MAFFGASSSVPRKVKQVIESPLPLKTATRIWRPLTSWTVPPTGFTFSGEKSYRSGPNLPSTVRRSQVCSSSVLVASRRETSPLTIFARICRAAREMGWLGGCMRNSIEITRMTRRPETKTGRKNGSKRRISLFLLLGDSASFGMVS